MIDTKTQKLKTCNQTKYQKKNLTNLEIKMDYPRKHPLQI